MKYRLLVAFLILFGSLNQAFSQSEWLTEKLYKSPKRKHQIWIQWGYNRGQFTKSDIHFEGPGYDFTLDNVVAKDRQSPFDVNVYFNPKWLSVPQFNIRLGGFLTERFSLSIGYDHMKYVMVANQIATINGTIDASANSNYTGTYNNQSIQVTPEFLRYEHTNGLNYFAVNGDFFGNISKSSNGKFQLDFYTGGGFGFLYPRSDVDLFDVEGINIFHVAGWGLDVEAGLRMDFFKVVYLNIQAKAGFIAMPNVLTVEKGHKAQQHFFFVQEIATLGFNLNIFHKKTNIPEN